MIPSPTTAANMITGENRTNNDDVLRSDRGGGGSGTRSGHESKSVVVLCCRCTSVDKGTVGAGVTRSCSAAGIRGCSRNRLGAYSPNSSSAIGAPIFASHVLVL